MVSIGFLCWSSSKFYVLTSVAPSGEAVGPNVGTCFREFVGGLKVLGSQLWLLECENKSSWGADAIPAAFCHGQEEAETEE